MSRGISRNLGFALGIALGWLGRKLHKSLEWLGSNVLKPLFRVVLIIAFVATAIVVVPEIIIWLAPESTYGYASEYCISPDKVAVEPKPHDCEFMKAPVGNNHCHLEKEVDVVKDERGKITGVVVTWNKVRE